MRHAHQQIEMDWIGRMTRAKAALQRWVRQAPWAPARAGGAAGASLRRSRRARQRLRFRLERFVGLR
jgi:hypothetical protein